MKKFDTSISLVMGAERIARELAGEPVVEITIRRFFTNGQHVFAPAVSVGIALDAVENRSSAAAQSKIAGAVQIASLNIERAMKDDPRMMRHQLREMTGGEIERYRAGERIGPDTQPERWMSRNPPK